jgi:hypothetical protein
MEWDTVRSDLWGLSRDGWVGGVCVLFHLGSIGLNWIVAKRKEVAPCSENEQIYPAACPVLESSGRITKVMVKGG